MSKLFEQLGKLVTDNPKVERLLAAAIRDGLSVAKIPSEIAGDIKRGLSEVGESAAGVLQSGAKLVDDYGPEIRMGEKGGSMSLLDPANIIPLDASQIADGMGFVKETLGGISEEDTDAEIAYKTAIEAMDGKIRRLEEGEEAAAPKSAAAVEEDMLVEGSEDYPAGRAKKSARKVKRRSKRKGKEPLIATERSLGDYAADAMAESAEPAPEVDYTDQAIALFKNTHGTSFDPKSSMDRGKLEKMKAILAERGGLGEMSPNQFALQVYRNS